MNRKVADEPMSLETDHEDIAMMYLAEYPTKQGNCPTCHSEVEIGGKEGETRWFIPAQSDWDELIIDLQKHFAIEIGDADVNISVLNYLKENYNLRKKIK